MKNLNLTFTSDLIDFIPMRLAKYMKCSNLGVPVYHNLQTIDDFPLIPWIRAQRDVTKAMIEMDASRPTVPNCTSSWKTRQVTSPGKDIYIFFGMSLGTWVVNPGRLRQRQPSVIGLPTSNQSSNPNSWIYKWEPAPWTSLSSGGAGTWISCIYHLHPFTLQNAMIILKVPAWWAASAKPSRQRTPQKPWPRW